MATESKSQALTKFQLDCRKALMCCPVCFARGSGLHSLVKQARMKENDDGSLGYGGEYWVCEKFPNHEHYYLSEGGASNGPRERKGAALPVDPKTVVVNFVPRRDGVIRRPRKDVDEAAE